MVTPSSSDPKHPRLLSFTLDGWDVLGDRVSVTLSDGVAVLVGRNGAGKSAILEGFKAISSCAVGGFNRNRQSEGDSFPKILNIEILTPTERHLKYTYEFLTLDIQEADINDSAIETADESQFSWNDHCEYIDGGNEVLWTTKIGLTTLSNGNSPITAIFGITGLGRRPQLLGNPGIKLPDEIKWIHTILSNVRIIGINPIHQKSPRRRPSLVSSKGIYPTDEIADMLSRQILHMKIEEFNELSTICKRVGLSNSMSRRIFNLSGESTNKSGGKYDESVSSVLLDDVNIGLLSDGTLRVLSILLEIITSSPSATTIIEEPEVQIHPGMLAKLLNEIESYTYGENLVLSTHSPQVVAWTSPDKINLVHRTDGKTIVRRLKEDEIQNVVDYLSEEGSLGEWLYSGIVDE